MSAHNVEEWQTIFRQQTDHSSTEIARRILADLVDWSPRKYEQHDIDQLANALLAFEQFRHPITGRNRKEMP